MTINKEYKDRIKKIFNNVYNHYFREKYFFEKPMLKLYDCHSSYYGAYCFQGFSYSDGKPVIKINIHGMPALERVEQTIIHEFAHMANHINLGHTKKPSHNVGYWKIAKQMGYKKTDYYTITNTMKKVYK